MGDIQAKDTTNETKAEIYETMAIINRSFAQIISAIYKLESKGIVGDDYAYAQETIASDLWTKINCYILASVNERELDDRNHYTRMRAKLEKLKK